MHIGLPFFSECLHCLYFHRSLFKPIFLIFAVSVYVADFAVAVIVPVSVSVAVAVVVAIAVAVDYILH
mgnify:CR=1 FL=1